MRRDEFVSQRAMDADTNIWYKGSGRTDLAKNTSFSLGEHFSDFIEAQVSEGRYGSASDVVRASLRLLEEQEAKLAALRTALIAGEESGPAKPLNVKAFLAAKRKTKMAK